MSFTYSLELEDGSAAEAPTFTTAVPNWTPGDNPSASACLAWSRGLGDGKSHGSSAPDLEGRDGETPLGIPGSTTPYRPRSEP
jgi:hypothetical protein